MARFSQYLSHYIKTLCTQRIFVHVRKKVAVFGIIVFPITSISASMTLYIDNTSQTQHEPVIVTDTVVNLDEPIVVSFASPVRDTAKYQSHITVYPATPLRYTWEENNTRLTVAPQSLWEQDTEYTLMFPQNMRSTNDMLSVMFVFSTEKYPEVVETNMYSDHTFAKNDDITIDFDRDMTSFDMQVITRPFIETEQRYDADTRKLHVTLTKNSATKTGVHALTVFIKHQKQDEARYMPIYSTSFHVFLDAHREIPKEYAQRLVFAQKTTIPRIKEGKYIDVNLTNQITTLFDNGVFVTNFISSTGAQETPTPKGQFQIYNKHPYALSQMFQVYLPHWMAFTPDGKYGFHGLIVWPKGHEEMPQGGRESEISIGHPVSAGCVRHDAKNSEFVYQWADIGTPVIIY